MGVLWLPPQGQDANVWCVAEEDSVQRPRSIHHSLLGAAAVVLTLALAVLSGCSSSSADGESAVPLDGPDSAYCDTARKWAVHELNADEATETANPAAFRKYWNEYLINLETQLQQAPPAVHDAAVTNTRGVRTIQTPLYEKYDFDVKRIEAEGSASERAGEPPPDVAKAQAALHAYQDRVCGYGGTPPAADVTFTADSTAKRYSEAAVALNPDFEKVASSGFDPEALRSLVTGDSFAESLDAQDATAPSEIATDVKAVTEWFRTRWSEVVEDLDYDIRRLLLEGTAEDRAVFTRYDPAIVEHESPEFRTK